MSLIGTLVVWISRIMIFRVRVRVRSEIVSYVLDLFGLGLGPGAGKGTKKYDFMV